MSVDSPVPELEKESISSHLQREQVQSEQAQKDTSTTVENLPKTVTVEKPLTPIHLLLRKDVQWMCKKSHQEAINGSKALLRAADGLVHYSSDSELVLACEDSPYRVGAALSQRRKGESVEKPLGFMSRTLTPAEKRYSQLDKEGLAVIFGIQRFH